MASGTLTRFLRRTFQKVETKDSFLGVGREESIPVRDMGTMNSKTVLTGQRGFRLTGGDVGIDYL